MTENRIKIADRPEELEFNEKNMLVVDVNGRKICVAKTVDGLSACVDRCPHAGGSLSEGFIDAHQNIVCPVHHYRFNLRTGRDAMNEGYFLKRFKVETTDDGVYLFVD